MKMTLTRLFAALAFSTSLTVLGQSQPPRTPPCAADEHRQFDFWIGYWEVTNPDGDVIGHNDIRRMAGDCGILETWRSAQGHIGMSINAYDPSLAKWTQRWVGADGSMLWLLGGLDGDRMVLTSTTERESPRGRVLDRITWEPHGEDRVTQHWEFSRDGGETWNTLFLGDYTKTDRTE